MENKKSKRLRTASRLVGYIGVAICVLLLALELVGLLAMGGTMEIPVPFVENTILLLTFQWLQVWITAGVAALIIVVAVILRVASAKAAKKVAPVAATKADKVRSAVASAKDKVQNIKVDDATKEKVTAFVKKNAPVIIAVAATFVVTATADRVIMHKKLQKLRRR